MPTGELLEAPSVTDTVEVSVTQSSSLSAPVTPVVKPVGSPEYRRRLALFEEQPIAECWKLIEQSYIRLYPKLAVRYGLHEALFLSQALYWTRVLRKQTERNGWFFKSIDDWEHETGLTRTEQATVRKALRAANILEEKRCGMPARVWYRVNLDVLGKNLYSRYEKWDWRNPFTLASIIGSSLMFCRPAVDLTGSVKAAALMAHMLHNEKQLVFSENYTEFRRPSFGLRRVELGMSRHEMLAARRKLKSAGFISDRVRGIPPVLYVRLNVDTIIAALAKKRIASPAQFRDDTKQESRQQTTTVQRMDSRPGTPNLAKTVQRMGSFAVSSTAALQESGVPPQSQDGSTSESTGATNSPLSCNLNLVNPAISKSAIQQPSVQESGQTHYRKTTYTKPPPTPRKASAGTEEKRRRRLFEEEARDLIWPDSLKPPENMSYALTVLEPVPARSSTSRSGTCR
jgi:hypothetical protein